MPDPPEPRAPVRGAVTPREGRGAAQDPRYLAAPAPGAGYRGAAGESAPHLFRLHGCRVTSGRPSRSRVAPMSDRRAPVASDRTATSAAPQVAP